MLRPARPVDERRDQRRLFSRKSYSTPHFCHRILLPLAKNQFGRLSSTYQPAFPSQGPPERKKTIAILRYRVRRNKSLALLALAGEVRVGGGCPVCRSHLEELTTAISSESKSYLTPRSRDPISCLRTVGTWLQFGHSQRSSGSTFSRFRKQKRKVFR